MAKSAPESHIDPRFTNRDRQPGLDFLRALAILVVVLYHCGLFGFSLPSRIHRFGWIGVDLFFVLSGYLIGGQLLASISGSKSIGLGRFFARRALRIMPAYFVVLAIYFGLPWLREYPTIPPLWKFVLSVQNINLLGGTSFSHAWSLAIEDQFYLLLPFLLLLVPRFHHARFILPCGIVAGGLVLRGYLAYLNLNDDGTVLFRGFQKWIYYPTWTRLDPLVFGVTLAAVERFRKSWWQWLMNTAVWLWPVAFVVIIYGLYLGENNLTVTTCIWQLPLIAIGMAMLVICALSPRLPFSRVAIPGAAFIASIVYSVYLTHKLVIHQALSLCTRYSIESSSVRGHLLVEVLIYAAGAILFFAIERPFLQLRHRVAPRPRIAPRPSTIKIKS